MTEQPLAGQLALVTGASRGIGAATAKALAAKGAHVVVTARTARALEEVEQAIFDAGGSATIAPLDLTQTDSIAKLATAIGETVAGARHPGPGMPGCWDRLLPSTRSNRRNSRAS